MPARMRRWPRQTDCSLRSCKPTSASSGVAATVAFPNLDWCVSNHQIGYTNARLAECDHVDTVRAIRVCLCCGMSAGGSEEVLS